MTHAPGGAWAGLLAAAATAVAAVATPVYLLKDYWFDWKNYHPATAVHLLGAAR